MVKKFTHIPGFTLIELLIVVAILGILAAIVIISLNSARQSSKNAAALSIMKSVNTFALKCGSEGYDIAAPAAGVANPGNAICPAGGYADTYPDLTKTGYVWHAVPIFLTTSTGSYAFTAHSTNATARIVCGQGLLLANWYGLAWDFRSISGCKTDGF